MGFQALFAYVSNWSSAAPSFSRTSDSSNRFDSCVCVHRVERMGVRVERSIPLTLVYISGWSSPSRGNGTQVGHCEFGRRATTCVRCS